VAGWLDTDDPAVPCPECRPELSDYLRDSVPNPRDHADGLKRSSEIRHLARSSRKPPAGVESDA